MWTWISFTILFLAISFIVAIFRLYIETDDEVITGARKTVALFRSFSNLTPSQIALGKYFIVVTLLLLVQIGAGSVLAHYYAEREDCYGFDISGILPFAFLRDVHIQAPIAWIGLDWIGSALFLAPLIGHQEPKGQKFLVNLLFLVTK